MFNLISLDSFFAGPNGEIDWHNVDDEFNQYAVTEINKIDTILFGRVTYQLFEDFWPKAAKDPATRREDLIIANKINEVTKIVFSKTLEKVTWEHAQLHKEIIPEEIQKIKGQEGQNIILYGSGTIVQSLTNLGLIDEYRLLVNPLVLAKGKSLFANLQNKLPLKLLDTKTFKNGNVLLIYAKEK